MELCAHKVRVILDLENFHPLTRLILADELQTSSLQLSDVLRVDLISMTVPLFDLLSAVVKGTDLGPLAIGLEDSLPGSETHGASHVVLVKLGHGDDDAVAGSSVELFRVGSRKVAEIAGKLDGGGLKAEADLVS